MVPVWRNTLPDQIAALAEMVLGACANAKRDPNQFRDRCPEERVSPQKLARSPLQSNALRGAEFTYNSCVIDVPAFLGKGSGAV